ncbi:hypothetical protein Btru_072010 [Bulinus truncatus]|nr:hypothetical protein Btru_072010 [Bulinus truncatus]
MYTCKGLQECFQTPNHHNWNIYLPINCCIMMMEEEEETLFDQENLLNDRKFASEEKLLRKRRMMKTLAISMAFFCLGLCVAIPGPTLIELGRNVNSNTEHMSYIFTARSMGYLIGSVVGGILFDFFDQQILLFYTLASTALATIGIPWCSALVALSVLICVQGIAVGVLDTGGNVFCIKIWGQKSPPYMQVLHFSFGVGAFLAPLIVEPFFIGNSGLNHSNIYPYFNPQYWPENTNSVQSMGLGNSLGQRYAREIHRSLNFTIPDDSILTSFLNDDSYRRLRRQEDLLKAQNETASSENVTSKNVELAPPTMRPRKPSVVDPSNLSKDHADSDAVNSKLKEIIDSNKQKPLPVAPQPTPAPDKILVDNKIATNESLDIELDMLTQNQSLGNRTGQTYDVTSPANSSDTPSSTADIITTATVPSSTTTSSTTTTSTTTSSTTTTSTTTSSTTTSSSISMVPSTAATSASPVISKATLSETSMDQSTKGLNTHASKPSATFDDIANSTNATKPQVLDRSLVSRFMEEVKSMSKIQFAYLTIGLLLALNAAFFLFLHYHDLRSKSSLHLLAPEDLTRQPDTWLYKVTVLGLLFFFFLVYVGLEVTFGGLITTFAEDYPYTQSKGAMLAALFWGCLAAGRGMSIIIARHFKPPCMMVANLTLTITGACFMSFVHLSKSDVLWLGTVLFGLGMSSIYPTAISWADLYYPLTGRATAVFVAGSGIGEMTIPVLTAHLYQNGSPMALMYMSLTLSLLLTLLYASLQIVACRRPKSPSRRSHAGFMRLQNSEEMADAMDMSLLHLAENRVTENLRRRDVNSVDDDKCKQNGGESEFSKLVELSD